MSLDLAAVPPAIESPSAEPPPDPPRHYRRLDVPALAERLWRVPLALAAGIFAACGPVHALGYTDLVYQASLAGLALGACAVPLGLLGLRGRPASGGPDRDT